MRDMTTIDMSEHRARREASEQRRSNAKHLEQVDAERALSDLLARCQALATATVDERAAEEDRREKRRVRMRDAGIVTPRGGTPQGEAWERIVRASCATEAAFPGHAGSAVAMGAIDRWQAPGVRVSTFAILGSPGTGKTVAAWYAIANEGGHFIAADDIAPTPRWDEARIRAQRTALLVVNDTSERLSVWAWNALAALVEGRHDVGRRTLVTSNMTVEELLEKLGTRMQSRFGTGKGSQGATMKIEGSDLRLAEVRS